MTLYIVLLIYNQQAAKLMYLIKWPVIGLYLTKTKLNIKQRTVRDQTKT